MPVLLLLVERVTPLQPLACAMRPRPMPLRHEHKQRELPAVMMAADDDDDFYGREERKPDEDVDLDVAWNRYSLEYLFNAYEVAYETAFVEDVSYEYEYVELTDEQQAEEEARLRRNNVVNSLFGGVVACCVMAIILHTYIMQVSLEPEPDPEPEPCRKP